MDNGLNYVLKDTIESQGKTIRHLKQIIIVLIISWLLSICFGFGAFVWYESQFEYETGTITEVTTDGENANAEYNDIEGDQYNDNSQNNKGVK